MFKVIGLISLDIQIISIFIKSYILLLENVKDK